VQLNEAATAVSSGVVALPFVQMGASLTAVTVIETVAESVLKSLTPFVVPLSVIV
jgi:hypothetical protein